MTHSNWGTPPPVAEAVVQLLMKRDYLNEYMNVLEPSCGRGAFLDALCDVGVADRYGIERESAFAAIARHPGHIGDFFTWQVQTATLIVGNPPFSGTLGLQHVEHAKSLNPRYIAFILPLGLLELCENRGSFTEGLELVVPMPRYPYINLQTNTVHSSGQRPNCLYVWNRGYRGQPMLDVRAFRDLKSRVDSWKKGLQDA